MWKTIFIFSISLVIYISEVASSVDTTIIRGVPLAEQRFFKVDEFACRKNPSKKISFSKVNDDYCDCEDGSDEPGTEACPNGRFYCTNKGYVGEYVFSSRVNDGICDCCDGSDEYKSKANCPNTCFEKGAELRRQQKEEKDKYENGLKIKKSYIEEARKAFDTKRSEVQTHTVEIERLNGVVAQLEADLKVHQEKEDAERAVLEEQRKLREAEEAKKAEKAKEEAANNNPSHIVYQNAPAPAEPKPESVPAADAVEPGPTEVGTEQAESTVVQTDAEETRPVEETPAEAKPEETSEALNSILEGKSVISSFLDENVVKPIKSLLGLETNNEVHTPNEADPSRPSADPNDPNELYKRGVNDKLSKAREELSNHERDKRQNEDVLGMDFGKQGEFYALYDKCFERQTREYTYKLCPFKSTEQAHTNLGSWNKWETPYTVMLYDRGQQCWGGPQRSTKVTISCSDTNEILDITEYAKCEYAMKFTTPAACDEAYFETLQHVNESHGEENYFS